MKNLAIKLISPLGLNYFLLCLLIPLVITSIWFRSGYTLMGAEEGPIFYQPSQTFNVYQTIWTDSGLGLANPLIVPRIPFYGFIKFVADLGVKPTIIQHFVFFILILIPLLTLPLLVKQFFPKAIFAGQISAIFYLFNLYSQSQIWYRFLYPQIWLWSYLPLFLWLITRWLTSRQYKWLAWLLLSSFVYSLLFSFISTVIVLWSVAGIIWLYLLATQPKRLIISLAFLGALLSWLITNLWWLLPLITVQNNNYSALLNADTNLIALADVSRHFPISTILLLKQNYFFSSNPLWNKYLINDLVPITILVTTLIGLIGVLRTKAGLLFGVISLIGLIIAKGANPPFGSELFKFMFSILPLTQIFRNPYEKYGLVWLLGYAIFFGLGVNFIFKRHRWLAVVFLAIICLLSTKPLWTGTIYSTYSVNPPTDYYQVNQILNNSQSHRILSLPFLTVANVRYNWGYRGEELSEIFLVKPSLSRTYNAPGDIYPLLENYLSSTNFPRLFPILAIDQVVIHHDVLDSNGNPKDSSNAIKFVQNWLGFNRIYNSSNLTLYRFQNPIQWGYLANQAVKVADTNTGLYQIINGQINPAHQLFFQTIPPNLTLSTPSLPEYQVSKIAANHYQFQITNASQPFYLILSTSYNPNWVATINHQPIDQHFLVNGYANGWFVQNSGNYTIDLKFTAWPY